MNLEQLYFEKLNGLDISDLFKQLNEAFIQCEKEYQRGLVDDSMYYWNTYPFNIFPSILRKKYSTKIKSINNSNPSFPIRSTFVEWEKTGKVSVADWMDDFIVSETDVASAMHWLFQVVSLLRIPLSSFDSLCLPAERCFNTDVKLRFIPEEDNQCYAELFITDRCINENEYFNSKNRVGKSFSLIFTNDNGDTYTLKMYKEAKSDVIPNVRAYRCTCYVDKDDADYEQMFLLLETSTGIEIIVRRLKVSISQAYKYLLRSEDFSIRGRYWKDYNKACLQKGQRVEDEYKMLRDGISVHYNEISQPDSKQDHDAFDDNDSTEIKVSTAMKQLRDFRLTDVSKEKLKGYFRYHIMDSAKNNSYHFIVQTETPDIGIDFSKKLIEITSKIGTDIKDYLIIRESDLLHITPEQQKELDKKKAIIITAPLSDELYYPSDSISSAEYSDRCSYDRRWKNNLDNFRKKPIFFCVPSDILNGRIRSKSFVYYPFFRHVITLENMPAEEIFNATLKLVNKRIRSYSDSFEAKLKEYIDTVYQKANLKNMDFVNDLFDWMVELSYEKIGNCKEFTADCIPFYHRNESLEVLDSEFQKLVGLENIKNTFRDIGIVCQSFSGSKEMPYMHMVFRGNPGTGKTTVAKKIAKLFSHMGIIKKNYVYEVCGSDMLGRYRGSTGPKVEELLKRAEGGVLFIDEAYVLNSDVPEGEDFRQEAIGKLLKGMDKKNNPIIIFSGYDKEIEAFLKSNPGLKSRIGYDLSFKDYSVEELIEIFKSLCEEQGCSYDDSTLEAVRKKIVSMRYDDNFGNARSIETLFIQSKTECLKRNPSKLFISEEDIVISREVKNYEELKEELDELIGIDDAKRIITEQVLSSRFSNENGITTDLSNHMIFVGNPGTGKTTVAQLFSEMLFSIGVAKSPRTKMITAKDLYSYDTAKTLSDYFQEALGGVLFIDEIYMLSSDPYRLAQVVSVLLELLEEKKNDITVILAGYEKQMDAFLNENPGLKSRFPITARFNDFSEDELCQIFSRYCQKAGMCVDKRGAEKFRKVIIDEMNKDNFGNGRTVRNIFDHAFRRHAVNYYSMGTVKKDVITAKDIEGLTDVNEKKIGKLGF